jgi:hypothetical protein
MLQRIQTLWALLAVACAVLTLKFSFFSGNLAPDPGTAKMFKSVTATSNVFLLVLTVAIIVAGLVNIFNYKNRRLQARITLLLILLSLVNIVLYYRETRKFFAAEGTFDLTAVLALAIPVFLILAVRGIIRDEKLVKSADRLR